ncbi:MAG: glutaredoxin [Phenylobacterium sp.]|jgi:glutaredoxin
MKALLITLLRQVLGQLVIFVDFITRPKPIFRTDEQQGIVDAQVTELALYQHRGCPFCVKVRREAHRLNIQLPLRDIKKDQQHREELEAKGGRIKVPCLRIVSGDQEQWMYESSDINAYLDSRFGDAESLEQSVEL